MTEQKNDTPSWKLLEHLVADIQRQLSPEAVVTHNASLKGVDSEASRQIDVLVEQRIGQYAMRIVVDCKDYAKPVDVKGVEEFHGLVRDVRAHKGALVCPNGFSEAAKTLAQKLGVEIYSPVDTEPHKWTTKIALPVVCDVRSTYMSFDVRMSAPVPFMMPPEFFDLPVYNESEVEIGNIAPKAMENWNLGRYPIDPGEHNELEIFSGQKTKMDNGYGLLVDIDLYVGLLIKQQLYFGYLPLEKVRGLRDEQTGMLVTNAFTTASLEFKTVKQSWMKFEASDELPMPPVLSVVGLDCYSYGT